MEKKRKIPLFLQELMKVDVVVTAQLYNLGNKLLPRYYHTVYKYLEFSCHGLFWLVGWLAFIWVWNSPFLRGMQVNFYLGLLFDIVVVAVLKASTRRRRPAVNRDMFLTIGVDKFSFPSGHATRACFISHFFTFVYPLSSILKVPLLLWSLAVCISRVLLRRHHILDVFVGAIVGVLESVVISYVWLSKDTCVWILSAISDEN